MRLTTTAGWFLALVLANGVAAAAEGRGGTVSGGSSGPSSGGSSRGNEGASDNDLEVSPDRVDDALHPPIFKPWEIEGLFESHRLVRQEDLNGQAADKAVNFYYAYFRLNPTEFDRITLRGGLYQRFLADPGESGVRADDTILQYTRLIQLPQRIELRLSGWLTAPTSFVSQKQSVITVPRVTIQLGRRFGLLNLEARTFGEYDVEKYSSADGGGNPNPRWRVAAILDAELRMPFWEPLSIGASVGTDYTKYHDVGTLLDPHIQFYGAVSDSQFPNQPISQSYSFQAYLRYLLPELAGFRSDILVAYGVGDPTLGYASALRDGVTRVDAFYRKNSEVYASLSLRYLDPRDIHSRAASTPPRGHAPGQYFFELRSTFRYPEIGRSPHAHAVVTFYHLHDSASRRWL